jgi:hypothetical protein
VNLPSKANSVCIRCLDKEDSYEKIDHPNHYQGNSGEAIDLIEAFDLNFSLGSAVKYIIRAGKKPKESSSDDLAKAIWYLQRELERKK